LREVFLARLSYKVNIICRPKLAYLTAVRIQDPQLNMPDQDRNDIHPPRHPERSRGISPLAVLGRDDACGHG
jgi:hypothetical protein